MTVHSVSCAEAGISLPTWRAASRLAAVPSIPHTTHSQTPPGSGLHVPPTALSSDGNTAPWDHFLT
jgi:hypothetical protein